MRCLRPHFTSVSKKAERSLSNVDHKGSSYVADDEATAESVTRQPMVVGPALSRTPICDQTSRGFLFEMSGGRVTSILFADPHLANGGAVMRLGAKPTGPANARPRPAQLRSQ
jgi:hypothetical protein